MKVGRRRSRKLRSGGAIATGLLATVAIAASGALANEDEGTRGAISGSSEPNRLIVEWRGDASPRERRSARAEAAVDYSRDLGSRRFQLVEPAPGQSVAEAIGELEADPAVVVAERDGYLTPDAIPDDPLFGQLWGLRNLGLGVDGFGGALAGADIDADGAWDRTVGTPSTVVADIDSGYRFEPPDLANVAWTNPDEMSNGLDDDGDGSSTTSTGPTLSGPADPGSGTGPGSSAAPRTRKIACVVPKLPGRTLARARAALVAAGCKLGKVRKPRRHHGLGKVVVRFSKPRAGKRPADGRVDLVLVKRPRKAKR
jgi:hypothetical protein